MLIVLDSLLIIQQASHLSACMSVPQFVAHVLQSIKVWSSFLYINGGVWKRFIFTIYPSSVKILYQGSSARLDWQRFWKRMGGLIAVMVIIRLKACFNKQCISVTDLCLWSFFFFFNFSFCFAM